MRHKLPTKIETDDDLTAMIEERVTDVKNNPCDYETRGWDEMTNQATVVRPGKPYPQGATWDLSLIHI